MTTATAAETFDPTAAAGAINSDVRMYAGSNEKLHNNLVDPLVSSAPMTRFDGTTFDVQIGCETEKKAIEMLIIPGAGGDISTTVVSQDLNNDGELETTQTLPFSISGVCTNGFVSCLSGTWSSCHYYQWDTLPSGLIQLQDVPGELLGGCYCTNNHCGSNLVMNNLTNVLGDLTSGAMAKMTERLNNYSPVRFVVEGNIGRYFVRSMDSCSAPVAKQTNTTYFNDPAALNNNAFTASTNDVNYELITTSAAATESQSQLQECSTTRQLTTTVDIVNLSSCTEGSWFAVAKSAASFDTRGSDAWIEAQAYCDPQGPLQVRFRAWDGGGHSACNAAMGADAGGFVTHRIPGSDSIENGYAMTHPNLRSSTCYDDPVFYSGSCVSSTGSCTFNFTFYNGVPFILGDVDESYIGGFSSQSCNDRSVPSSPLTATECVDVPGGGSVIFDNEMTIPLTFIRPHLTPTPDPSTCRLEDEWIDDQCQAFNANASCSLFSEDIDATSTLANFMPTGLVSMPSSRTFADAICSLTFARDWWQKDRVYRCLNSANYTEAIEDATYRAGVIKESVDMSTHTYSDIKKTESGWGTPQLQDSIEMTFDTLPACMRVCKTHRVNTNTDAGGGGVSSDLWLDNKTNDYTYKECDANSSCPLEAGEILDTDCGCINEFHEAAGMVQVMRYASRDLICTSGVPQQP